MRRPGLLLFALLVATTVCAQTTTTIPADCPVCIDGIQPTLTSKLGFKKPTHCQCRGDVPLSETLDGIDADLWEKGVSLSRFGAVCDGITPIDDAITAAYAAAPPGGIILIPPGTGPCVYGNTLPNAAHITLRGLSPIASWLKYTGNGYAVTMATSSDGWQRFERFTLEITAAAQGGFKMIEQNRYNRFTDVEVVGATKLAGVGFDLEGSASCNCFNTWDGCVTHNLKTGWLFSGEANANHIVQSSCYTAGTCLAFQAISPDAHGGRDNEITRFEVDGSTDFAVLLQDGSNNNVFTKLVADGATNSFNVPNAADVNGIACRSCSLGPDPIGAGAARISMYESNYEGNDGDVDRTRIFRGLLLNDPTSPVSLTLQRTTPFSLTDDGGRIELWPGAPPTAPPQTGIVMRSNGKVGVGMDPVSLPAAAKMGVTGDLIASTLDKGGAEFNVEAYGVIPNDGLDDTAAFQAVVDLAAAASPQGGTVRFCGTYNFTTGSLVLKNGVKLKGCGRVSSVLDYTGPGWAVVANPTGAQFQRVSGEDFAIAYHSPALGALLLRDGVNYSPFEHVSIFGYSISAGTGIAMQGQVSCNCINAIRDFEMNTVGTCFRLSGFANSNLLENGNCLNATSTIDTSAFAANGVCSASGQPYACCTGLGAGSGTGLCAADTLGGSNNEVTRVEATGAQTIAVKLRSGAATNHFTKFTGDGITTAFDCDGTITNGGDCSGCRNGANSNNCAGVFSFHGSDWRGNDGLQDEDWLPQGYAVNQVPLALTNGANADLAIGKNPYLRLTGGGGSCSITGMASGSIGRQVMLQNATGSACLLKHSTGTAANRFFFASTADLSLPANTLAVVVYDGTDLVWRLAGIGG